MVAGCQRIQAGHFAHESVTFARIEIDGERSLNREIFYCYTRASNEPDGSNSKRIFMRTILALLTPVLFLAFSTAASADEVNIQAGDQTEDASSMIEAASHSERFQVWNSIPLATRKAVFAKKAKRSAQGRKVVATKKTKRGYKRSTSDDDSSSSSNSSSSSSSSSSKNDSDDSSSSRSRPSLSVLSDGVTGTRSGNVTVYSNGSYGVQNGTVEVRSDGVYGVRSGNTTVYSNGTISYN